MQRILFLLSDLSVSRAHFSSNSIGVDSYACSVGVRFGESLLEPERLLFQLHNETLCMESMNGFTLMRYEAVLADEAVKFETSVTSAQCFCHSDEDMSASQDSDESDATYSSSTDSFYDEGELPAHLIRQCSRRKRHDPSNQSIEEPLFRNEEDAKYDEDLFSHRGFGNSKGLIDGLSLTSFLDGISWNSHQGSGNSVNLKAVAEVPPPPPPRARTSTNSVPVMNFSQSSRPLKTRGTSLQMKQSSDATTESSMSDEDFMS